jgi:hypothetical protein
MWWLGSFGTFCMWWLAVTAILAIVVVDSIIISVVTLAVPEKSSHTVYTGDDNLTNLIAQAQRQFYLNYNESTKNSSLIASIKYVSFILISTHFLQTRGV